VKGQGTNPMSLASSSRPTNGTAAEQFAHRADYRRTMREMVLEKLAKQA